MAKMNYIMAKAKTQAQESIYDDKMLYPKRGRKRLSKKQKEQNKIKAAHRRNIAKQDKKRFKEVLKEFEWKD